MVNGTFLLQSHRDLMAATADQKVSRFFCSLPVSNHVHAQTPNVTDACNLLDQDIKIESLWKASKIPSRTIRPPVNRVKIGLDGLRDPPFDVAGVIETLHYDFRVDIHAHVFGPQHNQLGRSHAPALQEAVHAVKQV